MLAMTTRVLAKENQTQKAKFMLFYGPRRNFCKGGEIQPLPFLFSPSFPFPLSSRLLLLPFCSSLLHVPSPSCRDAKKSCDATPLVNSQLALWASQPLRSAARPQSHLGIFWASETYLVATIFIFTARRVCVARTMPLQDVRLSVCLSVCHTPVFSSVLVKRRWVGGCSGPVGRVSDS